MSILNKSANINVNYAARIARVDEIHPIPDAHSIVKAVLGTDTVVVSKDTKVGDTVVFFPVGACISSKYLREQNLYSDADLNSNYDDYLTVANELQALMTKPTKDEEDISKIQELDARRKHMVGFFSRKGNVRCIKLRGQVSMGYVAPVATLEQVWPELRSVLWSKELGNVFDMVGTEELCWKYIPVTRSSSPGAEDETNYKMPWYKRSLRKLKKFDRLIPGFFRPHYDTAHLDRNAHLIDPMDKITETVKVHGCVERGTMVETQEYGEITIGEIVDNKLQCHVKAFDTTTQSIIFVPIGDWYLMKNDGEWYDIELEDGRKLTITGNNPVWVPEINGYRRVDELTGAESLLVG